MRVALLYFLATVSSAMAFMSPMTRRAALTTSRVLASSAVRALPRRALTTMRLVSRGEHLGKTLTLGLLGGVAGLTMAQGARAEGEDFQTTDTGLKYKVLKEGTGAIPSSGQTVAAHYTGWLDGFGEDGRKFDSSYDRRKPLNFRAGVGQVIQGWDQTILDMKVGEKRQVIIPANLGYGSRGAGGVIPPNATLFFEMELVNIL